MVEHAGPIDHRKGDASMAENHSLGWDVTRAKLDRIKACPRTDLFSGDLVEADITNLFSAKIIVPILVTIGSLVVKTRKDREVVAVGRKL